jgi:mono/diheme cytochrome c family protein
MKAALRALAILAAVAGIVGGILVYSIARRGLSTRVEPSRVERAIAGAVKRLAVPRDVRDRPNPVEPAAPVVDEALAHFAEHCAICHANDGSGDTEIGRGLYPPAPDMRAAATQALTDGELFSIIENGVRLTGMPAWGTGTPEGERESWALVHFVRRLPGLPPDDIERMKALNPKTPEELREEEEIRRFLSGESAAPQDGPASHGGRHE